jgi:leucyl-tRNA synthetase
MMRIPPCGKVNDGAQRKVPQKLIKLTAAPGLDTNSTKAEMRKAESRNAEKQGADANFTNYHELIWQNGPGSKPGAPFPLIRPRSCQAAAPHS